MIGLVPLILPEIGGEEPVVRIDRQDHESQIGEKGGQAAFVMMLSEPYLRWFTVSVVCMFSGLPGLGLHLRKQHDVADAFLAEEHHAQAIDADANAARGRHAVLQRHEEIVVGPFRIVTVRRSSWSLGDGVPPPPPGGVGAAAGVLKLCATDHGLTATGSAEAPRTRQKYCVALARSVATVTLVVSDCSATDLAGRFRDEPIAGIVYTDIAKDGMLAGPNFESLGQMIAAVPLPVIASGGVTTVADVRRLAEMKAGGCILGRALYEGKLTLADAERASQTAS